MTDPRAQALAELEIRRRQEEADREPLDDFLMRVSPHIDGAPTMRPDHLEPVCRVFERAARLERVYCIITLPPGWAKTTTILHGLVRAFAVRPETDVIYATAKQDVANSKSDTARTLARRAGVPLRRDRANVTNWRTIAGGGFQACSVGAPPIGERADIATADDLIRNAADAASPMKLDKIWRFLWFDLRTRLREHGSLIVTHTRWAELDPIGRLEVIRNKQLADSGETRWEIIHIPALDENEQSTCPWYSTAYLHELREGYVAAGEADVWWSLYMGAPRPPSGTNFRGVTTYSFLPEEGLAWAAGVDLAYSSTTSSDWNAIVIMARDTARDTFYVVHVDRWRGGAETHQAHINHMRALYPQAFHDPALFLGSGTEKSADVHLDHLEWRNVTSDKDARSKGYQAAWNEHEGFDGLIYPARVYVPEESEEWDVDAFVREHLRFPGKNDDQVDAANAAYVRLAGGGFELFPG